MYAILRLYARDLSLVDTVFKTSKDILNQCYLSEEKVIYTAVQELVYWTA